MSYYQARLSIETARLLEKMRVYYEKKTGGSVSKGDCLIMSYTDSLWVQNWKEIFDKPIPQTENYEVSQTAQLLKVQVTDDFRDGIDKLKKHLPVIIGTRSVTVGVCIREILKASHFKNLDSTMDVSKEEKIKTVIGDKRELVLSTFDEDIQDKVIKIIDSIEIQILDLINKNPLKN
ncbi:MAG: hypothetical protein E6778_16540 [Niallia nealsonii]|nr:hypothetical protein [Niallia nealsonii]